MASRNPPSGNTPMGPPAVTPRSFASQQPRGAARYAALGSTSCPIDLNTPLPWASPGAGFAGSNSNFNNNGYGGYGSAGFNGSGGNDGRGSYSGGPGAASARSSATPRGYGSGGYGSGGGSGGATPGSGLPPQHQHRAHYIVRSLSCKTTNLPFISLISCDVTAPLFFLHIYLVFD